MVATVNSPAEADRLYQEAIARSGKIREEKYAAASKAYQEAEQALKQAKKNHHDKNVIKQLEQAVETAKKTRKEVELAAAKEADETQKEASKVWRDQMHQLALNGKK